MCKFASLPTALRGENAQLSESFNQERSMKWHCLVTSLEQFRFDNGPILDRHVSKHSFSSQ